MKEVLDVPDLRGKMCTAIYSATVKIRFLVRICMDAIREKETLRRLLNERNAMRTKTFILALFAVVGAYSCRVAEETPFVEETIPFNSYGQVPCESPDLLLPGRIKRVVLDSGGSKDYIFSEIDKIVCHQDRFYILDWIHRKIVIYDSDGGPVGCLSRRGRGPGEYLQITDFDVDADGSVWVVDGQQDMLLHYSPEGECVESRDFPFEVEFIKVLKDGRFLFSLAPWDSSKYGGKRLIVTDRELNVEKSMLEYGEFIDPNYAFPSVGFPATDSTIYYHRPIDDCVYALTYSGDIVKKYVFDFGQRRVPGKARKDIGKYRSDFGGYTMLVKSVSVGDDFIIGSVLEGKEIKDFIIDRVAGAANILTEQTSGMYMVGITEGYAIYRENHDNTENPDTAEEVLVLVSL